jgi:hypothetical protein
LNAIKIVRRGGRSFGKRRFGGDDFSDRIERDQAVFTFFYLWSGVIDYITAGENAAKYEC